MKMKKMKLLLGMCLVATTLFGCGSAPMKEDMYVNTTESNYDASDFGYEDYGAADYEEMEFDEAEEMSLDDSAPLEKNGNDLAKNTNRKLIRNVDMSVESEDFDTLLSSVEAKVESLGGYIENSYINNGSRYDYRSDSYLSKRNANMTIRIPAEKLDEFLTSVSDSSNVLNKSENVSDVTLQYVDIASRKKSLEAEQDRLLELLDMAQTIEDIITIQDKLSEVQYQIESLESSLRTYDNQVDYSTVSLSIDEVVEYTPVEEKTVGQRLVDGFLGSLKGVGEDLLNLFVWIVVNLPYLIVWAIVIVVGVFVGKKIAKKRKEKKAKKVAIADNAEPAKPEGK